MHLKIHRGAHEIGGTCVEVFTDTTRIVLDPAATWLITIEVAALAIPGML